ncbi:MAG TPA: fructosamine kinase family protein [Pseudonocardiaceae bacterium]
MTASRAVFVKRGSGPGAIRAEAAGLRWLASSGAVRVPTIREVDDNRLVLDRIDTASASARAAEELGRGLAGMHSAGAPAFGAPPPGGVVSAWIGQAPMRNITGASWPEWYAEHRVLPYLKLARDRRIVDADEAALITRACDRLPELAGPAEPPARLHGDLWSGNVLWGADGHAWLIDPAAHGGHRETDLAMLRLFGCPCLNRIIAGYQEVAPLADGWPERVPLHQLFPLLVHVVLFGGGYVGQTVGAARAVLSI